MGDSWPQALGLVYNGIKLDNGISPTHAGYGYCLAKYSVETLDML